jgi:hypothetical protein
MVLAGTDSSWTILLPGFLVASVGTGLFNPAVTAVALGSAPIGQSGLAAGVNDTFRQAGLAIGVAALGALVPAEEALGGGSPAQYVAGMHDALWAAAAVALAGSIAAGVLIRGARPDAAQPVQDTDPVVEAERVLQPA